MNSENKKLELTEEQRRKDAAFLDNVRKEHIIPLVGELEGAIEGYADKAWHARMAHVIKLNEPLQGKGDFLPLGNGALVYAGKKLGKKKEFMIDGVEIKQYQPRFWGDSDGYHAFADDERMFMTDGEYFLSHERKKFDSLPVSYRAAFLVRYIGQQVAADKEAIISFVLGASETLETRRFIVTPTKGAGVYTGWNIRIRELQPDKPFWNALRTAVYNGGRMPAGKPKARRKGNDKTDFMCRQTYQLEQDGVILDARKKGGIGYAKVIADLQLRYPDKARNYDPDTFGRVYRDWKKRNGLS